MAVTQITESSGTFLGIRVFEAPGLTLPIPLKWDIEADEREWANELPCRGPVM